MFIVNKAQYKIFEKEAQKAFVLKMLPELRNRFPEKTWKVTDEVLQEQIFQIINRASSYKIVLEKDVLEFIYFDLRFGSEFEKLPKYKETLKILLHKTLTGSRKVEKIFELVFKLN